MEAIIGAIFGVLALLLVFLSVYTVKQQTFAVIERFGKFTRISSPGLHFKWPIIENVVDEFYYDTSTNYYDYINFLNDDTKIIKTILTYQDKEYYNNSNIHENYRSVIIL